MQTPLYVLRDPWLAFLRVLHMVEIPYLVVVFVSDSLSLVCRNSIGVLPTLQYSNRNICGNYSGMVREPVFLLLGWLQA
jgi:hypothetical protein